MNSSTANQIPAVSAHCSSGICKATYALVRKDTYERVPILRASKIGIISPDELPISSIRGAAVKGPQRAAGYSASCALRVEPHYCAISDEK